MTKKFQISIHGSGSLNDAIVRILTNHAEGRIEADFDLLESHARADYANWPSIRPVYELKRNNSAGVLDIYEGDKHTMTIIEKHYFELSDIDKEIEEELTGYNDLKEESDRDDLKGINI